MQQKIEQLQAQLGDVKGKRKDTPSVSYTLDPLSQKLENENMELEFQVLNYAKENAHLKTTYKNLFDSIKVTRAEIKAIIDSLQDKLHDTVYENAKLRAQLFDKVFEQGHQQRVNNTTKTKRPHPRSNSNTDRVPSKSKSSYLSNNVEKIEENHKNSQIPKNQKHMSSECNNITLAIQNVKSEIICVMCKQCLVTANHDVCVLNYVNNMSSHADNQSANVTIRENQKKYKANAKNLKELGSKGSLASSRPSKPRTCLRWIPTGIIFAMCGKLTTSSNTENKSEKSVCDNASTSNPSEPSRKWFPISTSLLGSWKVYSVIYLTNYSNGENQVVSKSFAVTTADVSDKRQQQQDSTSSTSSTSTLTPTIIADGNFDL
ncbi:hypothetical protein Tco_0558813 [Tanacetum coccineum]